MKYETQIKRLASSMAECTSKYFTCPKCLRENKFGISIKPDGIVFNCFSASCGLKGLLSSNTSVSSMASILNRKPKEGSKATFELPTYLLSGFASENSLKMALKYDLLEAYGSKVFRTDYDPRLDRQVFYYRNNRTNAVVGAMGRALRPHNRPKALIYPNSQKTPWICGKFDEAVIVEDIFSAVKCYNIGKTGIALSGTTLAVEYLTLFKDYTKVYICLDKDASLKALDMKKLLDIFNKSVIVRLLDKDIKDLTRDEARKLFV